jgi:hypothetical protein
MGCRSDQSYFADMDMGEFLLYTMDKSGIEADVEAYIDDKWGPF